MVVEDDGKVVDDDGVATVGRMLVVGVFSDAANSEVRSGTLCT